MMQFLHSLTPVQGVFLVVAVVSTLFLVLQIVLAMFGADGIFEHPDLNLDVHGDIPHDIAEGHVGDVGHAGDVGQVHIGFFNMKSLLAFFFFGGWIGLLMSLYNHSLLAIFSSSLISASVALVLSTLLLRKLMSFQSSGNLKLENAIGQTADVYLKIGPKPSDIGKVTLIVQDRFVELDAVTSGDKIFKTGEKVSVIGVNEDHNLIVEEAV